MGVRLYGRDIGNGSLVTLSRGFQRALGDRLEGFVAIDRRGGSEENDAPPGALASDGIFVADLNQVRLMTIGARHERHWVQVTPNSTHIPPQQLHAVVQLPEPRVLSCSPWGTRVILRALQEMGFEGAPSPLPWSAVAVHRDKRVPVLTVRHGITGIVPSEPYLERTRLEYQQGRFTVVHFSTSIGERKGTLELVQAWEALQHKPEWQRAQLLLVLDVLARSALEERLHFRPSPNVIFVPRMKASPEDMALLLCRCHLLAAPSRGEGFGLLPLEARACGVPVLATVTTGHGAGHVVGRGVVAVPQETELRPIDDGPGALAPALDPAVIAAGLQYARDCWLQLHTDATADSAAVREEWSWERQLAPLVQALEESWP